MSPTTEATSAGTRASYSMRPSTTNSRPKTAPAMGVPNTEPNPPATPAARSWRRTPLPTRSRCETQSVRLAPICTAVPSRPALPPNRWVSTVPTSTIGAMRKRQLGALVVDRVDDQVVARLDRLPEALVDPADRQAGDRKRVDDDLVREAKRRRSLEQPQEERRGSPAEHADERPEPDPLAQRDDAVAVRHADTLPIRGRGV